MPFWPANAPLLATGQTTDYTPAGRTSKDDGGEERGISRQYEVLTTGQFSGTTTITVNSIADAHSNEVVVDKRTGLMWQRTESPASYGTGAEYLLWDATGEATGLDEEDIFFYVDQATAQSLSGFTDWRVPTLKEFISILNYEAANAKPDSAAWPSISGTAFWTSTTVPSTTTSAQAPSTTTGNVAPQVKTTIHNPVILVRGGR